MRIGYILDTFPSVSETFILREIQALQEQGLEITIMALRQPAPGTPVHAAAARLSPQVLYGHVPLGSVASKTAVGLMKQVLRLTFPTGMNPRRVAVAKWFADQAEALDIRHFHAHFATLPTDIAWAAANFRRGTFSFSAHARDIYTQSAASLQRKIKAAAFVAACTEDGLHVLEAACSGHHAAARAKLHLVRHGLLLDQYPTRPAEFAPAIPLVAAVGRLEEKKGFDDLLRACSNVMAQRVTFQGTLVGNGSEYDNLRQLLEYLQLESRIEMVGAQAEDFVSDLLRKASLFVLPCVVLPSGDRDGIPNVILEAWACGCPVITTTSSAVREVMRHDVHGVLVPPRHPQALADAMLALLADPARRQRLGKAGRQLVETQFDARNNVAPLHWQFQRLHR